MQLEVLSLDVLELDTVRFQHEVILLRRRIERFLSLLRLVVIVLRKMPFPTSVVNRYDVGRLRPHETEKKLAHEAVCQYLDHYHGERNHQGRDNRIIDPADEVGSTTGDVACRERIGGMLWYYYRQAA